MTKNTGPRTGDPGGVMGTTVKQKGQILRKKLQCPRRRPSTVARFMKLPEKWKHPEFCVKATNF